MTEAKRAINQLKQVWQNTNDSNWDTIEQHLKRVAKLIDGGNISPSLTKAYLEIKDAFDERFGGRR